jgi:hypothetical protein
VETAAYRCAGCPPDRNYPCAQHEAGIDGFFCEEQRNIIRDIFSAVSFESTFFICSLQQKDCHPMIKSPNDKT